MLPRQQDKEESVRRKAEDEEEVIRRIRKDKDEEVVRKIRRRQGSRRQRSQVVRIIDEEVDDYDTVMIMIMIKINSP